MMLQYIKLDERPMGRVARALSIEPGAGHLRRGRDGRRVDELDVRQLDDRDRAVREGPHDAELLVERALGEFDVLRHTTSATRRA